MQVPTGAPTDRPLFSSTVQRRTTATLLVALMAAQLVYLFWDWDTTRQLSWLMLLGAAVAASTRFGLREFGLITVCLVLSVLLARDKDWASVAKALDQAAFLTGFILLMSLLREAAASSPAIRDCGAYLTRQPPKWRYLAIQSGGHVFGILLNFGAISLMAPLIQRGVQASNAPPDISLIRERRQLSALIRGFAWMVVWAPTTVTQALLVTVVSGVDALLLAMLGFVTAMLMMGTGWLEDFLSWRRIGARLRASGRLTFEGIVFPRRAFRHLFGICVMLLGLIVAIRYLSGVRLVYALMLSAPLSLVLWVAIQNIGMGAGGMMRAVGARLAAVVDGPVPNGTREAITLGASGFIGVAAAKLLPVQDIARSVDTLGMDPALVLLILPVLIILAGQIALSPIMMVVFLGAVFNAFPAAPVDPTLFALSLSCGWALSMTASANVTGSLTMARLTGYPATLLTWQWNLKFSAMALAVLAVLFWILTRVL